MKRANLWVAPQGLHIEFAEPQDVGPLAKLHLEGFFKGWSEDELLTYVAETKRHMCFLACDAKRKAAGFMILRQVEDEVELLTIVVGKRFRGKGVGDAILRAGFDELLRRSAKTMFLEVEEGNSAALHLYKQHGFEAISRREAYYDRGDGQKATALVMRRQLA